jgi:hypothetical protein
MSGFSHPMPSYTPFPSSRPDDLFYGGLRSSMQQSVSAATTSHFRPEENRNVPMSINNSYHERYFLLLNDPDKKQKKNKQKNKKMSIAAF